MLRSLSMALVLVLACAGAARAELAHCDEAVPLACGAHLRDDTPLSAPPHTSAYGCAAGTFDAREKVYRLDLAAPASLLATLSVNGNRQLVLFLLDSCDETGGCRAGGGTIVDAPFLDAGTYYLVVDGATAQDEGTFTIDVTCEPVPIQPLRCGQEAVATLGASSLVDTYGCGGDASGGEAWFEIDERLMQDLLLSASRTDVEMRLLRAPLGRAVRCLASGRGTLFYENPTPARYLLSIDSPAGTTGDVLVQLDCISPEPGECSSWQMNEGEGVIGPVGPFTVHGQTEEYAYATPPALDDPGWTAAPNPVTVDMSRGSTLCPFGYCLNGLEFTYFRTFVQLPPIVEVFTIFVGNVDDGAGFLLNGQWRDDHAYLGGGVEADLLRPPGADLPGALNEVMVVQLDDCCRESFLLDTRCYARAGERPCAAIAGARPPGGPFCPGDTVPLDASGTSVLDCDGDVLYQWFVDGAPLGPPSTDPSASVVVQQDAQVRLVVTCSADAACTDSDSFTIPVVPAHVPTAVGNALRVSALDKVARLDMTWDAAPGPFGDDHFHVLRAEYPMGPWSLVSDHSVRVEAFTDPAPVVGPMRLLFYDVRRAVCEFQSDD